MQIVIDNITESSNGCFESKCHMVCCFVLKQMSHGSLLRMILYKQWFLSQTVVLLVYTFVILTNNKTLFYNSVIIKNITIIPSY